jgi:hypothetical protein
VCAGVFHSGQDERVRKGLAFSTIPLHLFKFEGKTEVRASTNLLNELDAYQLDVASFLATLNLGLNGGHARGNQP